MSRLDYMLSQVSCGQIASLHFYSMILDVKMIFLKSSVFKGLQFEDESPFFQQKRQFWKFMIIGK